MQLRHLEIESTRVNIDEFIVIEANSNANPTMVFPDAPDRACVIQEAHPAGRIVSEPPPHPQSCLQRRHPFSRHVLKVRDSPVDLSSTLTI